MTLHQAIKCSDDIIAGASQVHDTEPRQRNCEHVERDQERTRIVSQCHLEEVLPCMNGRMTKWRETRHKIGTRIQYIWSGGGIGWIMLEYGENAKVRGEYVW